jgi:hypothetical protein
MNDQYDEVLALEEQRQARYWEALEWEEDDNDEELEELIDAPLSAETLQWIYDHF